MLPAFPPAPAARSLALDRSGAPRADLPGQSERRGRPGQALRALALGVLGLELLYLLGANAFFATKWIEPLFSNEDGSFLLRYERLWSWLPGRYHVRGLTIQRQGMGVQWILGVGQASFTTNPLTLLGRRFDVSRVEAAGVTFRLRLTESGQGSSPGIEELPPIPGYDNLQPALREPPLPIDQFWTVAIRRIDATATELWFQRFRLVGVVLARGEFDATPGLRFQVGPAQLDFLGGEVTLGASVIASALEGTLRARIEPTDMRLDPDRASVLPQVTGQLFLDAQLVGVAPLETFLPAGVRLDDGSGQASARLELSRGLVLAGSRVEYETDRLKVERGPYAAVGSFVGGWSVGDDSASSQVKIEVPTATLHHAAFRGDEPEVTRLEATFTTGAPDAAKPWVLAQVRASVGSLDVPDVRFFNPETLDRAGVVLEQGVARAQASVALDAPDDAGGDIKLTVRGLTARHRGDQWHAEVAFFAHLPPSSLASGLTLSDARLDLRDVFVRSRGKGFKRWWARLDVGASKLRVAPALAFSGPLTLRSKDATPALIFALGEGKLEEAARTLLDTNALEARATVTARSGDLDLRLLKAEGGPYGLRGRLRVQGEKRCGAMLISRDPLSLGIEINTRGTSLKPLASGGWLDARTAELASGCPR